MNQNIKELSVFFPAYNEEENIVLTVEKAIKVLNSLKIKWEIIIVDDGSKDNTLKLAQNFATKYENVKADHQDNGGYGMALRTGFKSSKYDWIVYTDSDGQFDFSEVTRLLEKTDRADYVVGYRIKRNDPFYRIITAKLWALSVYLLFGIWVKDIDCGFKLINKKVLDNIPPLKSTRGAMINAELLLKTKKAGFIIEQVGVNHYPRLAGNPTGIKLNVILKTYIDLFNLWRELR